MTDSTNEKLTITKKISHQDELYVQKAVGIFSFKMLLSPLKESLLNRSSYVQTSTHTQLNWFKGITTWIDLFVQRFQGFSEAVYPEAFYGHICRKGSTDWANFNHSFFHYSKIQISSEACLSFMDLILFRVIWSGMMKKGETIGTDMGVYDAFS